MTTMTTMTTMATTTTTATVALGIDRLLASNRLDGRRIGVVTNPASIDANLAHTIDRLSSRDGVTVAALFGPQHGFRADVQDNMIETPHGKDQGRGIPIYSLYSETREPTAEMLEGLDALVIDLQDVGTRVYTYIHTMAHCLEAAGRVGLEVIVCDRPNPIGGALVEGPVLDPAFRSFVGLFPIPLRHGMTIGELARLLNETYALGASLEVSQMAGWDRGMYHDDTGLPWVMPSPNIPTLDSATVYPGSVLFEGTTLSEGRGTTRPFELIGGPGVRPDALTDRLNGLDLDGVFFRPVWFEPTFQKHAGVCCGGCQIHVTDRKTFRPVRTAVVLMQTVRAHAPEAFAWRSPPYEYEHEKMPIDILAGTDRFRAQIEAGQPLGDIEADWTAALASFGERRRAYLLY